MRRKKKDEYHLLVAQNFLGNISLSGKHDDTNLKIFNSPGIPTKQRSLLPEEETPSVQFHLRDGGDLRVQTSGFDQGSMGKFSPGIMEEDPFSRSYPQSGYSKSKQKSSRTPTTFLRRFVKILSSDDVISSREAEHELPLTSRSVVDHRRFRRESFGSKPPSPISESHLKFLRKFRTSIAKGERVFLCSESTLMPVAVLSYFPFTNEKYRLHRSHSTGLAARFQENPFYSTERMRRISQCSMDELKPYDFTDLEAEISFGYLFGRRRGASPCAGAISNIRRSDRRDSNYVDSCARMTEYSGEASDTLGTMVSLATKDLSYEPDEIEWDEVTTDSYSPAIFEDIESSRKTVIRSQGYVCVTMQYSNSDAVKTSLNQSFAEKFPRINITFSKFRSITKEVVAMAVKSCSIDLSTIAQGLVFFEKIVHKALISKYNRKIVAGSSILVAMKLNDYSKESIKQFLDVATDKLRVPRREFIAHEIPLCAALHFDLRSSADHVLSHYQKLLISSV